MTLKLTIGQSSRTGPRERNEDYIGVVTPTGMQLASKGASLAIADGVGGNAGGREAAEMTVRSVLSDHYATPDTWEIHASLDKVLVAINRWIQAQSSAHKHLAGMATTLSMLVLRGRHYYLAHVGDSRIYRLRQQTLELLTTDHVWDRPDMHHVLKRAVGLDQHLAVDYADGTLEPGDLFVLMTDGVWAMLDPKQLQTLLQKYDCPTQIARHLTDFALHQGGQDNASALVVRIETTGSETLHDALNDGRYLTVPPKLKPGQHLDQFEIMAVLHASRISLLYQVRNTVSGQLGVLKTIQPRLAEDSDSCQALLNEEWLTKRVISKYVPQIIPLTVEQRSRLYYVMTWHSGVTLQQRLDDSYHFSTTETVKLGCELMRGLGALHRLNIVHRDIKPDNLHIGDDHQLRILDLGVALSATTGQIATMQNPGTPSFMAPELFTGEAAHRSSDLYAAGVTLYHMLTHRYPYGEIEPFQHPRFGLPVPPTRYRPEIPQWLENIVLKAVARDPAMRFETAEEMLLALEHGELKAIDPPPRPPLIARAPLVKWQWISLFSLLLNFFLFYLFIVS